jgi:hypothetical protein
VPVPEHTCGDTALHGSPGGDMAAVAANDAFVEALVE